METDWGAGYIPECTFGKEIHRVAERYSDSGIPLFNVETVLKAIVDSGVSPYLNQLIQNNDKRSDDAVLLLDEIQTFRREISEYQQNQTVKERWINGGNLTE